MNKSTENNISQGNYNQTGFQTAQDNSKMKEDKDQQDSHVCSSVIQTGTRLPTGYLMSQVLNEPSVSTKQIIQSQCLKRNDRLLLSL